MSSFSVDGLVSGLDTTNLIKQLMQLERQPQVRLTSRRDAAQKVIDLYRQMNTRFAAVETAADALSADSDWNVTKTSSSDTAVATATAAPSATAASLTFTVSQLARAHAVIGSTSVADTDTTVVAAAPFTIGTTTISSFGDGTLGAVADAINASGAGVRASIVQTAPGQYQLQITATSTGSASTFSVSGLDSLGTFGVVTQGTDASILVGDGPGAYDVVSPTGTFTDVLPGVTITAKSLGTATVTVESDPGALADRVEALVRSVNDATALVRTNSTYDATTRKAGPLLADLGADRLRRSLTEAITATSIDGLTASSAGIQTDRNGVVTVDRTKLLAAIEANPDGIRKLFTANGTGTEDDGIAERLRVVADTATTFGTGQIATAIEQRETTVRTLNDQIAAWDSRLALRERALKRQFSGLEAALGTLRNQSSWLAGAVNSLPSWE